MAIRKSLAVLSVVLGMCAVRGVEFRLTLTPGWNLISLPIGPSLDSPDDLFQDIKAGPVWEWNGQAYRPAEVLVPGRGYWVFHLPQENRGEAGEPVDVSVEGKTVRRVAGGLPAGWQLIGPITYPPYASLPLPPVTEPLSAHSGRCWQWDDGYTPAGEVAPGRAAWVCLAENCEVTLGPDPRFEGVIMAYSPEAGKLKIHWPEAVDDRTSAADMVYRVYAVPAGARNDVISPENLMLSVTGGTSATLAGLAAGQVYDVAVLAEDAAGNANGFNRDALAARTMAAGNTLTIPREHLKDLDALGMQILEVSGDGTRVTVADAAGLGVNDVIVFENPNGQGLKRILQMNAARDGTELVTADVAVAELIEEGELRASLRIADMDAVRATRDRQAEAVQYRDPAAAFRLAVPDRPPTRKETVQIDGSTTGIVSFDDGVEVGYAMEFEPVFETEARFRGTALTYCRMVARGDLSVDAAAGFTIANATAYQDSRKVYSVSHSFFYTIDGLPIWQEVGIDVSVAVDVNSEGGVDLETVFSAVKALEIGAVYENEEWAPIGSEGFDREMRFDIHSAGNLVAGVSVYPRIWSRVYGRESANFNVMPRLTLESEFRALPLPAELTAFDSGFRVDAYVEAAFAVFAGDMNMWRSPDWTMLDMPLFSLPEIGFDNPPETIKPGEPTEFRLSIQDGVNNPVLPENIDWWVETAARTLPQVDPAADRRSATVTAEEEATYRLWASCRGSSFTHELGTRYASAEFSVSAGPVAGDYLVIDLSPGPDASSYPVSTLESLPDPIPDEYKTTKLVLRSLRARAFTMGSPPDELGRSPAPGREQQHHVTLTQNFYIGVFEVTQNQWELVTGTNPSYYTAWYNPDHSYGDLDAQRPVDCVSYNNIRGAAEGSNWPAHNGVDSDSFMGRLRQRTGLELDLPTEAQWEYACRGGTTTALNSGKNLTTADFVCANANAVAWYSRNAYPLYWSNPHAEKGYTQPVGRKLPNAWGLYDMHGNLREWCLDWWLGAFAAAPVTDPLGPEAGTYRVWRGCSYDGPAAGCRSALRGFGGPSDPFIFYGLRVCCAPPAQ